MTDSALPSTSLLRPGWRWCRQIAGLAAAVLLLLAATACGRAKGGSEAKGGKGGGPKRGIPVTVATARAADVPLEMETFGTAQAVASVQVRAQVSALLQPVTLTKGQLVQQGDLLFRLQDAPYQEALTQARGAEKQARAALAQATAACAQATAALALAQATAERDAVQAARAQQDADRVARLLQQKVAAQDESDAAAATALMAEKTVKADQAAVAHAQAGVVSAQAALESAQAALENAASAITSAQVQLAYCTITAPITGRVGNLLVTAGNLVKAGDQPLVVINQISPIEVFFAAPLAQLDAIRGYLAAGPVAVQALLPGDDATPEIGQLTFVDNAADTSTGTIQLAAAFPNASERLWPGRYVRVRLVLTTQRGVTVVPARAVQTGSDGQFVFVIKADQTASPRPVTVARVHGEDAVIARGVAPGEVVVTDGQLQLDAGTLVEITGAPKAAKPTTGGPGSAVAEGTAP